MIGISRVDHICIAVRDLDKAMRHWGPFLGKDKPDLQYSHAREAIKVARYYVGEVGFELMCSTREGSEVDRFLNNHGEGIMLISFKVPDTAAAMETLDRHDYELIDRRPRVWENSRYAFLDPRQMNGVLVEVIDGDD